MLLCAGSQITRLISTAQFIRLTVSSEMPIERARSLDEFAALQRGRLYKRHGSMSTKQSKRRSLSHVQRLKKTSLRLRANSQTTFRLYFPIEFNCSRSFSI